MTCTDKTDKSGFCRICRLPPRACVGNLDGVQRNGKAPVKGLACELSRWRAHANTHTLFVRMSERRHRDSERAKPLTGALEIDFNVTI